MNVRRSASLRSGSIPIVSSISVLVACEKEVNMLR